MTDGSGSDQGSSGSSAGKALLAIVVAVVALAAGLGTAYLLVNSNNPTIVSILDRIFPDRQTADASPTATPGPTAIPTAALDSDWTWYDYPADGFGIGLPAAWVEEEGMAEDLEGAFTGGHLWIGLDSVDGSVGYLMCVVSRSYAGEDMTLDEALAIDTVADTVLSERRIEFPSGEMEKVRFVADEQTGEEATIYFSIHGDYAYFIMFIYSDPEMSDTHSITFDKIARSFRALGETQATPVPMTSGCLPGAAFVEDVTVPDGTQFAAGESFTKVWRVESDGCASWPAGTRLVFESGDQMGGSDAAVVQAGPNSTADVSLDLTAPPTPGTYQGYWQLEMPTGERFGARLLVMIVVP